MFTVDASLYGAAYTPPREVYGDLDRVVRPDLHYHYATPVCAQRWLDVCEDATYGHMELVRRVREALPRAAEALRADCGGREGAELCSLGPGDGSVDLAILEGLAGCFRVAAYTGLDFSFELLRRSVSRVTHAPGLPESMSVRAICGDFTDLGAVVLGHRAPGAVRVFALTGFTLGNYAEGDLLADIGRLMDRGDYLFLDARLHDSVAPVSRPAAPGPLQGDGAYASGSVRRFVLGPVEVATTVDTESLPVGLEVGRSRTDVPGALNLTLFCTGLDATLRLTGERVRRERLDLAVTTSYPLADLTAWLGGTGLATVWSERSGDVAFFLLRR